MTATLAGTLLEQLEDWLQKAESTDKGKNSDRGQHALNGTAVNALFNQMSLLIHILGTDAEGWKEVAEFIKQQSCRYKSEAVCGCLSVLGNVAKLFPLAP